MPPERIGERIELQLDFASGQSLTLAAGVESGALSDLTQIVRRAFLGSAR
jgi:hypothetical protein